MMTTNELMAELRSQIGQEPSVGPWLQIDQARIDAFAAATGDQQWIHVDVERAQRESPYGGTVAHGFLTLALLPYLTGSNRPEFLRQHYPGMRYRVNYGLDRVRFPAPVRAGERIRARMALQSVEPAGNGLQLVYLLTVEIENGDRPACVAEQVFRVSP